ncbi:hypothetical protein ACFL1T_03685 [Chlamydiota bacterium]
MKKSIQEKKDPCPFCNVTDCYILDRQKRIWESREQSIQQTISTDTTTPFAFSNTVKAKTTDLLCSLTKKLLEDGYTALFYDGSKGPVRKGAVAYIKEAVPFRREPLLIDCSKRDTDAIKIAIRDAEGKNKELNITLHNIFSQFEMNHPSSPIGKSTPALGTKVYALSLD